MIQRRERLAHGQRHQQFLREFLFAKGDRTAGHHDAFATLQMAFGDLRKEQRSDQRTHEMSRLLLGHLNTALGLR